MAPQSTFSMRCKISYDLSGDKCRPMAGRAGPDPHPRSASLRYLRMLPNGRFRDVCCLSDFGG